MTDPTPTTRGRRIFNVFAAIVLFLFVLFCLAISVGVAAIPKLREAAERTHFKE
jgi:hypothetical protein